MEQFELYRGEPAERALAPAAMVGPLDPGDDCQAEFGAGCPASPIQDVALQQGEERLHGGVVSAGADALDDHKSERIQQ